MSARLVFVYNADTGVFNTLADVAHKVFSPQTYGCRLCAITHTPVGMRSEWKAFITSLDQEVEFLHRDEFAARYPGNDATLPAIFIARADDRLEPFIDAATLEGCASVAGLSALIRTRLDP